MNVKLRSSFARWTAWILFCMPAVWLSATMARANEPPAERVIVVGQGRLTEIPYASDLTVTKAIIMAGGLSDFGQTPIRLIRCGQWKRVDLKPVFDGHADQDPKLEPWDIITIGTAITHRK
jgi:protein involved in polysaccharide export with SLBB domain